MLNFEPLQFIVLVLFIPAYFLDIFFAPGAIKKNLRIENSYINLHRRYGINRLFFIKLLLLPFFIYGIYANEYYFHKYNRFFVFIYSVFCYWISIQIFLKRNDLYSKKYYFDNPLDTFFGLLIYPFENLDSNKEIFLEYPKEYKWSWKAFFLLSMKHP